MLNGRLRVEYEGEPVLSVLTLCDGPVETFKDRHIELATMLDDKRSDAATFFKFGHRQSSARIAGRMSGLGRICARSLARHIQTSVRMRFANSNRGVR